MAQLIQHKRGRLERLSTITGSLQKGEILIVTGSSNITSSNGSSILFAATESGSVQATNRFIIGSSAPNVFTASIYGGLVNGVPYYDSGSGTLYLLGSDSNTAINLTGNISAFSSSVATSFSASNASIASVTGDFSSSVAQTFATQSLNLSNLSSSISQSIIDIVSASLSSSLSVIATDIEVSIISASLSSSQALISSSISTSLYNALDNIETYFPLGVISSSQQVIDIFNANFLSGSTMATTVDTTFATDAELFVTSSNLDAGEF
jgi:hypothetical protein